MTSDFLLTLQGCFVGETNAMLDLKIRFNHVLRLLHQTPTGLVVRIGEYPLLPQLSTLISYPIYQISAPLFFQFHISHSLSLLNIDRTVCDSLVLKISSYAVDFAAGSPDFSRRIFIVADVQCVESYWVDDDQRPVLTYHTPALRRRDGIAGRPLTTREGSNGRRNRRRREREGGQGTHMMVDESVIFESVMMGMEGQDWTINQNRGATTSAIEKLKEEGKLVMHDTEEDDDMGDCSVCLEKMMGEKELIKMSCTHIYHSSCIIAWLEKSNSCPLCRSQLEA